MKRRSVSVLELARRTDRDPSQIRKLKNRHSNPQWKTIEMIAQALDAPVRELVDDAFDEFDQGFQPGAR